jgi:hypothetical protein
VQPPPRNAIFSGQKTRLDVMERPLEDEKDVAINNAVAEDDDEGEADSVTIVHTSSDTEDPGHASARQDEGSETEEDAVVDRIITSQLNSQSSIFVEERTLRFYAAVVQFRIFASREEEGSKARAVAMSICETFVLSGAKLEVELSPPVHKGLVMVHGKLSAFYNREAYKTRPPRLSPDVFDRAAAELRARVRQQVNESYAQKLKESPSFREAAAVGADLDEQQDKYLQEELLLLKSKRMLESLLPPEKRTLRGATIRFQVPQPVSSSDVHIQVEDAFSEWMGGGTMTLRKVISLAHTPEKGRADKSVKSVAQLRTAARIESRVSAWAGSNSRISESVDVWSAKESGTAAKRRPGKKR